MTIMHVASGLRAAVTVLLMVLAFFVFTITATTISALLLTGKTPVIDLWRWTCSIPDTVPTQLNPFATIPGYEKHLYSEDWSLDPGPTWNAYDNSYLGRPLQSWQCPPILDL